MNHTQQTGNIILRRLHQPHRVPGVFLSFWMDIPKSDNREKQKAHVCLVREAETLHAVLLPIHYFPLIGKYPPRGPDLIFPHAMMLFIRKKLTRFGVDEVHGAISEREVQVDTSERRLHG